MICEGCRKPIPRDHGRAKVRAYCSLKCAGPMLDRRAAAFARAPHKPADGVTYGKAGKRDG